MHFIECNPPRCSQFIISPLCCKWISCLKLCCLAKNGFSANVHHLHTTLMHHDGCSRCSSAACHVLIMCPALLLHCNCICTNDMLGSWPACWGHGPACWGHGLHVGVMACMLGSWPACWGHGLHVGVMACMLGSWPACWGHGPHKLGF